jgi:hypothetical protein
MELENIICIDLDSCGILRSNYEYEIKLKIVGNNYDIMLLPDKLKILKQLQENFKYKSIVILSSDYNLSKYLEENEYEVVKFLPSLNYYQVINNSLNDSEKIELFKSYNNIFKTSSEYKIYSSIEELREMCKLLFI